MDSTTPTSSAPTTFHHFSQLATELRLKIWSYAIPPRVVSVRYLPSTQSCVSSTPLPALLHVNREARYEMLRCYRPFFSTQWAESYIYFNPQIDTVYMPRYRDMGYDETIRDFRRYMRTPEELDLVQYLTLDSVQGCGCVKRPWEAYDKAMLIRSFPNLEALSLVVKAMKMVWLSNEPIKIARPICEIVKEERLIEFELYNNEVEAARIADEFQAAFMREEEVCKMLAEQDGKMPEPWRLPPLRVVTKKVQT
jgi:hypothetical protein